MARHSSFGCLSHGLASVATTESSWSWAVPYGKKKSYSYCRTGSSGSELKGSRMAASCSVGRVISFLNGRCRLELKSCLYSSLNSCCPGFDKLEDEAEHGLSDQSAGSFHSYFDSLRTRVSHIRASDATSSKHDRTSCLHTCCMFL